jgi:hypothetical protein
MAFAAFAHELRVETVLGTIPRFSFTKTQIIGTRARAGFAPVPVKVCARLCPN